jgi:hypothetical protein
MTDPLTEPIPPRAEPLGPAPTTAPIPPLVTPRATKGSGRAANALLIVAALVAVGGITFAAGRASAPAAAAGVTTGTGRTGLVPGASFDPTGAGGPGGVPGGFGNRAVVLTGTVTSLEGSSLVITSADGTRTTIDVSGATFHAQAAATAADLTPGASVSISVGGFGGLRDPGASADPGSGSGTITATDVTVTGE